MGWPFHPLCAPFAVQCFAFSLLVALNLFVLFGSSPVVISVSVGYSLGDFQVAGRSHGLGCAAASNAGVLGLLSVGQPGAPSCSKVCSHGNRGVVRFNEWLLFLLEGEWNALTVLLDYDTEFGCTSQLQCTAGPSETMTLWRSLNRSVERMYCTAFCALSLTFAEPWGFGLMFSRSNRTESKGVVTYLAVSSFFIWHVPPCGEDVGASINDSRDWSRYTFLRYYSGCGPDAQGKEVLSVFWEA